MRAASIVPIFAAFTSIAAAQPPIDNVLEKMVPPGSTSLVDARMDQLKQTALYRKLVVARALPDLDEFALQSGFDPRRDVRELLVVQTPRGSVVLARGAFHLTPAALATKTSRHGEYEIHQGQGSDGLCILDSTLAAAGEVSAIEAALDEWKAGAHTAAQPLLAKASSVNAEAQLWGVSIGFDSFFAGHPPVPRSGLDFSGIFAGLKDTSFEANLTTGLKAEVHGTTVTEKDAANLRDAIRGMIGLGRLKAPEGQPDLLRLWDGIAVNQQGVAIDLRVDIAQDLLDKLIRLLTSTGPGDGRVI